MDAFLSSQRFQPYLFSGERVLWTGQPKQGVALSGRDAYLIPLSLAWCGFILFWNIAVWTFPSEGQSPPPVFHFVGLLFLVAGLYIVIGRFFHDAYIRKSMFYAVTDERVLVLRGSKISSLDIHRLPRLELSEHRDGTGTVAFEAGNYSYWGGMRGFNWWIPSLGNAIQFFRIDNPRRVYELIRDASRS